MMNTCSACEGFLPSDLNTCPHCDAALVDGPAPTGVRVAKRVAQAAGVAATMLTLMACYGGGPMGEPGGGGSEITDPATACSTADELPENGFASGIIQDGSAAFTATCTGGGDERIYQYDPGDDLGLEGEITVVWTTDGQPMGLYLRETCENGPEMACGAGSTDGTLTMHTENLQPFFVFIDGVDQSTVGGFELQVIFEPCGTTTPCTQ